jgi:hypothetical protein
MADCVTPPEPRTPCPEPDARKPWTPPRLVAYGTLVRVTHADSVSGLQF